MLNISRPSFIKLLEYCKIRYRKVGTHCRADLAELAAYDQQLWNLTHNATEFSPLLSQRTKKRVGI